MKERERVRERERGVKGAQSKPNPSPNAFPKLCKKGRGTRTVLSLRGKSLGIMSENYPWIIWELSSGNYDLVYHHAEKLRFIGILT